MLSATLILCVLAVTGPTREIAFVRDHALWIVNVADGRERQVATLDYDRPITWSPDGLHLLFWKHAAGWDIWRIGHDGTGAFNLTPDHEGGCRSPRYSPDGAMIALMRDDPPGLYVMDASGGPMRRLSERGHRDAAPEWAPDGSRLAYTHYEDVGPRTVRTRIGIVGVDGAEDRLLETSHSWLDQPTWSPDGRMLLCVCRLDAGVEVCLIDLSGDKPVHRILTRTPQREQWPVFSPCGGYIAMLAMSEDFFELRVMNADGGDLRTLARGEGSPWIPQWSPDGSHIAFVRGKRGDEELFIVAADGKDDARSIARGAMFPVWRPRVEPPDAP